MALAGLLALAGCAVGPEIRTDYDAAADFSRYTSFAFMPPADRGTRDYTTITDRRVMASIRRELEARGYREVEQNPDLVVNFTVTTEDVQDIRTVPSAMGPYPWYGWRGHHYYPWPAYHYETYVQTYERDTIYVDLVDVERRQLVWEGRAILRATRAMREDPAGTLDASIAGIFERYPFTAGTAGTAETLSGFSRR
jgi:hypothetical protein